MWEKLRSGISLEAVRVDGKGRVVIPKPLREGAGIREGGFVKLRAEGRTIVIEPVESIADKYHGAFKVERWPEDLDDFIVKVMRGWWTLKAT
jgi:AbrB family looped-hinge helix DNA binding protein